MLIVVTSLLLALVAGCGGGGNGAGNSSSSAAEGSTVASKTWTGSKQAFIEKADAICSKGGARIYEQVVKALYPGGIDGANPGQMKQAVETILAPGLEAEIRKIRALGYPSGEEEEVEAIFTAVEEQLERARSEPTVFLKEGDPFRDPAKLGEAYGFAICGGVA